MTIIPISGRDMTGLGPRDKERRGDWLCTYTGREFYPFDPRPEDFCIEDIAHALSLQSRFGGHCRRFYSIAEHSYRVLRFVELLPPVAMLPESFRAPTLLYALFHDAPEAYIVDVPGPLKRDDCMSGYREAEERIMGALCQWLGIRPTVEIIDIVKYADNVLLCAEVMALMPAVSVAHWHWPDDVCAAAEKIVIPLEESERLWINEMVFAAAYRRLALAL